MNSLNKDIGHTPNLAYNFGINSEIVVQKEESL